MAKQDYIPDRDPEFLTWHDNFKVQVTALAAIFDLTAAEVTEVADRNTLAHAKVADSDAKKATSKTAVHDKTTTIHTVAGKERNLGNKLKAHANYTEARGQQLGIVGPEDTTDLHNAKPTLTVDDSQPRRITLDFNKSVSDGVNIYSKRAGEAAFTFLARDTASPYVTRMLRMDNRAPANNAAEQRQYYALYVHQDEEIGQQSGTEQGVCMP